MAFLSASLYEPSLSINYPYPLLYILPSVSIKLSPPGVEYYSHFSFCKRGLLLGYLAYPQAYCVLTKT